MLNLNSIVSSRHETVSFVNPALKSNNNKKCLWQAWASAGLASDLCAHTAHAVMMWN